MNALEVIEEVVDRAGEYIEMAENPDFFVCCIMANKIIELQSYIEYLEKRVKHARI